MKFIHLSDLHLGKRFHERSLLDEQRSLLEQVLDAVSREQPDAVLLAGDIYDKPVPPAEAVHLFDDFLVRLAQRPCKTFLIAGNHDSADRLSFAARLIAPSGVFMAPVYDGQIQPVELHDGAGAVCVWMLPFLKPAAVRACFPDAVIESDTDALHTAIEHLPLNPDVRNVLVAHQFVTGAQSAGSETIHVGGADNVDAAVFAPFDYVALGHIHAAQQIGERIRYCGAPMKYSFDEAGQQKTLTVAELDGERNLTIRTIPLTPPRDLRVLKGAFQSLLAGEPDVQGDLLRITLTDEQEIPDAVSRLRTCYPNVLRLDYDNARTRLAQSAAGGTEMPESKSPQTLFAEFFEKRSGHPMTEDQSAYLASCIEEIWGHHE